MTETTAKKGMVRVKTGHTKNDFDYAFLKDINYDDRELGVVIETLFGNIKALKEENTKLREDCEAFKKDYETLKDEHDRMLLDVKSMKTSTLD